MIASTTKRMTSASAIARRACSWTRASIGSSGSTLEPAGVDDDEPAAVPLGVAVQPVTRRPAAVLDDRRALPEDAVEERALADVRATDDGDDRERPAQALAGPSTAARRQAATGGRIGCARERGRAAGRRRGALERGVARARRACARTSGVPASSRIRSATSRRSSIGVEVPPVTPTTGRPRRPPASVRSRTLSIWIAARAGDLAQPGQFLGVRAGPPADDDHQVDLAGRLERVLLAPDRDRADGVDDLELVGARDHERGELLELPGRLGRLADERHPLRARDGRLPLLFLVDDDRVGREPEQADDLGVLGRARAARSCSRPRRASTARAAPG